MRINADFSYSFIQKLCVFYLLVWTISPPLSIDISWRLIALSASGIWFFCALQRDFELTGIRLAAIYFAVIVALIAYLQIGNKGVLKQIGTYILVISFLMNEFYNDKFNELDGLVPVALILFTVFNFKTVAALFDDPTLARKIVRNDESIEQYILSGVGGYAMIYTQVIISAAITAWTAKNFNHNIGLFLIGIIWLTSFLLMILKAGYSIALFTTVAGILLYFFYNGNRAGFAFFIGISLFIGIIASIMYITGFREWLLQIFDGTAVAKKINDLMATSESGGAEGSIADRVIAYESSFRAIFKYPILGSAILAGEYAGGGHSEILDTTCTYGIPGIYLFIKSFFSNHINYRKKILFGNMKRLINAEFVQFLFVTLLDTIAYDMMISAILLLPIVYNNIEKMNERENRIVKPILNNTNYYEKNKWSIPIENLSHNNNSNFDELDIPIENL